MAKGKAHDDKIKSAVMAALLEGRAVTEVADEFELDKSVVSRWKSQLPQEELQQLATKKKQSLLELVEGHLTASLKAATALAEKSANDNQWFSKQSASDIAILYGVLSDKSIRLVEAAQRAYESRAASQLDSAQTDFTSTLIPGT